MLEGILYFQSLVASGGYAPLLRDEAFFVSSSVGLVFALGASPDGSVLLQQADMSHATVSGARLVLPSNGTTAASMSELAAHLEGAESARGGMCFLAREAALAMDPDVAEARAVHAESEWDYSGRRATAVGAAADAGAEAAGGSEEGGGLRGAKKRR